MCSDSIRARLIRPLLYSTAPSRPTTVPDQTIKTEPSGSLEPLHRCLLPAIVPPQTPREYKRTRLPSFGNLLSEHLIRITPCGCPPSASTLKAPLAHQPPNSTNSTFPFLLQDPLQDSGSDLWSASLLSLDWFHRQSRRLIDCSPEPSEHCPLFPAPLHPHDNQLAVFHMTACDTLHRLGHWWLSILDTEPRATLTVPLIPSEVRQCSSTSIQAA